jgi:cytochrome P450
VDEFCTFYTAGVDTTSHFLTMMIYYVAQNPKIEERLRYEVDQLISCDEDITF